MQADEEVGKIAMATPVLISKALELFLQDLCDRTYDITLKRGAKTMNSHHLKECVHSHSVFDFLRETVSRVPDLEAESASGGDNGRRRKAVDGENDESCDEDSKRTKSEIQATTPRGRGRGRGRGRKRNNTEKTRIVEPSEKPEDTDAVSSPQLSDDSEASPKSQADEVVLHPAQCSTTAKDSEDSSRNPKTFDLNMDLDENGEASAMRKEAEYQSQWLGAGYYALHPTTLQQEPEEDYDCEDED